MTQFRHIMIDLETMGSRYDAPILSIGAVFFDPTTGEIGDDERQFYAQIDPTSALAHGTLSGDTLKWWMAQSDAAREAAMAGKLDLDYALAQLSRWMGRFAGRDVRVWGNGAAFDVTILEYAHARLKREPWWKFRGVRDCRTINELAEGIAPVVPRPGNLTSHNALDDAIYQAMWVSAQWQALRAPR